MPLPFDWLALGVVMLVGIIINALFDLFTHWLHPELAHDLRTLASVLVILGFLINAVYDIRWTVTVNKLLRREGCCWSHAWEEVCRGE